MIKKSDFYLLPNVLTLTRTIAVPLVAVAAYFHWDWTATAVFGLAGLSDYFDGWIARRYASESKLGMLLDPLCDKLIVVSTMIILLSLGRISIPFVDFDVGWVGPFLVIVTVGREITITGLRAIASSIGIEMPVDRWGKFKTWIQFFAIVFLLTNHPPILEFGQVLLIFSAGAALLSGFGYIRSFMRQLPN